METNQPKQSVVHGALWVNVKPAMQYCMFPYKKEALE